MAQRCHINGVFGAFCLSLMPFIPNRSSSYMHLQPKPSPQHCLRPCPSSSGNKLVIRTYSLPKQSVLNLQYPLGFGSVVDVCSHPGQNSFPTEQPSIYVNGCCLVLQQWPLHDSPHRLRNPYLFNANVDSPRLSMSPGFGSFAGVIFYTTKP